jgi:hypothetical protein
MAPKAAETAPNGGVCVLLGIEPIAWCGVPAVRPRWRPASRPQLHCAGNRAVSPDGMPERGCGGRHGNSGLSWRVPGRGWLRSDHLAGGGISPARAPGHGRLYHDPRNRPARHRLRRPGPAGPSAVAGKLPLGQAGELTGCVLPATCPAPRPPAGSAARPRSPSPSTCAPAPRCRRARLTRSPCPWSWMASPTRLPMTGSRAASSA